MKTLYHVSLDYDISEKIKTKKFIPRIPEDPMVGEDYTTPRICFGETIEGCIQAIGGYYDDIDDCNNFYVYTLIVDENSNFYKENIRDYNYLHKNKLVPDAISTKEYWLLCEVELKGEKLKINESSFDYHLCHEMIDKDFMILKTKDLFKEINLEEEYYNILKEYEDITELYYAFHNILMNFNKEDELFNFIREDAEQKIYTIKYEKLDSNLFNYVEEEYVCLKN